MNIGMEIEQCRISCHWQLLLVACSASSFGIWTLVVCHGIMMSCRGPAISALFSPFFARKLILDDIHHGTVEDRVRSNIKHHHGWKRCLGNTSKCANGKIMKNPCAWAVLNFSPYFSPRAMHHGSSQILRVALPGQ